VTHGCTCCTFSTFISPFSFVVSFYRRNLFTRCDAQSLRNPESNPELKFERCKFDICRVSLSLSYTRCLIHKSIITPHFEYSNATPITSMSETRLGRLQRAQNRAMRVMLHCDRHTKTKHMLQALQFMSVRQRLCYSVCIFIYKILNDVLPVSLRNKIEIAGSESQRRTKRAGNIVLELRKTRNAQKSVFSEGAKMYDSLPLRIKQYDRLKIFKRELKEYNTI